MDHDITASQPSLDSEARQGLRLQRVLLAAATSAGAVAITFVVAGFGFIPYEVAVRFAIIVGLLAAVFYGLIRSRLNLRFADPALAMPMAVCTGLATSYVVFEGAAARPTFLAFYLMALMFSVFFLEGPRLVRIAAFYFACYAAVIVLLIWLRPETTELRREIFRLVILAIILAWFGGVGWYVGRLRRRLRRSNAQVNRLLREQRMLFDTATVGIAFTRERAVLNCNNCMCRLFGYADGGMVGVSSRAWFPSQESWEERGRQITAAFARRESYAFEEEFVRADGRRFWCHVSGAPVDPDDPVSGEGVFVFADVTERRAQEDRIRELALVDALTGLPNRRVFDDRLRQAIAHAQRDGGQVAVLLFDLDGFKQVNDTYGHGAGDEVLAVAAGRLRSCFRAADTVARLGGDEFVAVVEGRLTPEDLESIATKAIQSIATPIQCDGVKAQLGVSIGAAVFPVDAREPAALLTRADVAMYDAKAAGGGAYRRYASSSP